jgi:hypothetical protein
MTTPNTTLIMSRETGQELGNQCGDWKTLNPNMIAEVVAESIVEQLAEHFQGEIPVLEMVDIVKETVAQMQKS